MKLDHNQKNNAIDLALRLAGLGVGPTPETSEIIASAKQIATYLYGGGSGAVGRPKSSTDRKTKRKYTKKSEYWKGTKEDQEAA